MLYFISIIFLIILFHLKIYFVKFILIFNIYIFLFLQDFTLDFYFRQSWNDDRLTFEKRHNINSLTVGAEVADLIWVPDTFFANEKTAYFHQATTPNTFLRISPEGSVFRSMRLDNILYILQCTVHLLIPK